MASGPHPIDGGSPGDDASRMITTVVPPAEEAARPASAAGEPGGTPTTAGRLVGATPICPRSTESTGEESTRRWGVTSTICCLPSRSMVMGMERSKRPTKAARISSKVRTFSPSTATMRSPARMPAVAAGMAGSTYPTRVEMVSCGPKKTKK